MLTFPILRWNCVLKSMSLPELVGDSAVIYSNHLFLFRRQVKVSGGSLFKVIKLVVGKSCNSNPSPILPHLWPWTWTCYYFNSNAGVRTGWRPTQEEDANYTYEIFSCISYGLCHAERDNTHSLSSVIIQQGRTGESFFFSFFFLYFLFPSNIFRVTGKAANFLFLPTSEKSASIWSSSCF